MIALRSIQETRIRGWEPLYAKDLRPSFSGGIVRLWQRVAWWLFLKSGIVLDRPVERLECKSVAVNGNTLIERAKFSQRDLRMIWAQEAKYIVVGHRTSRQLWGECDQFFQFAFNERMAFDGKARVIDLQVVVVPWLEDGILLLPELRTETPHSHGRYGLPAGT